MLTPAVWQTFVMPGNSRLHPQPGKHAFLCVQTTAFLLALWRCSLGVSSWKIWAMTLWSWLRMLCCLLSLPTQTHSSPLVGTHYQALI